MNRYTVKYNYLVSRIITIICGGVTHFCDINTDGHIGNSPPNCKAAVIRHAKPATSLFRQFIYIYFNIRIIGMQRNF